LEFRFFFKSGATNLFWLGMALHGVELEVCGTQIKTMVVLWELWDEIQSSNSGIFGNIHLEITLDYINF
jgi:hypothetical protein